MWNLKKKKKTTESNKKEADSDIEKELEVIAGEREGGIIEVGEWKLLTTGCKIGSKKFSTT